MKIIEQSITRSELSTMAREQFGDWIKAVVDIERGILAVGAEFHADMEAELLAHGSVQENLWGINLYPDQPQGDWIIFDSMINVRPSQGNLSRGVQSQDIQVKIRAVVGQFIL